MVYMFEVEDTLYELVYLKLFVHLHHLSVVVHNDTDCSNELIYDLKMLTKRSLTKRVAQIRF